MFREHLKAPFCKHGHCHIKGHTTTVNIFSIVEREDQNLTRTIKESIYIRVNGPFLNKDIVEYHPPHIFDEVLFNIPVCRLKYSTLMLSWPFHLLHCGITPAIRTQSKWL